ncbi:hypothetical protein [Longispora albida]|uniref:hypothetical protein n=1 Tax=Longispora albida TaxID=203523 RepID=UPI00036EA778|nr:hypothetical protein [Longispora albida]
MGKHAGISRSEFEQTLQQVQRLLGRVSDTTVSISANINSIAQVLPASMTKDLRALTTNFTGLVKKFFRLIAELIGSPGWPPAMYSAGQDWTAKVGAKASSLAGKAGKDQTKIDDVWEGMAATAYADTLEAQAKALTSIKEAADEIDDALWTAAMCIAGFWIGSAVALIAYVVELEAAAVATATVIGAPAGVTAAGGATVQTIALWSALIAGAITVISTLITQCKDLAQRLADNEAFPGGKWPASATGSMSDGSLSDGDATDWHIKTA